ncbi:ATP-binding protein [Aquimonas sp.]|uniref:sensor histidine kinase n=1 Tax=Aquimonas sp. TaxID=1872588 RepID=UPI0037C01880
MSRSRHLLRRLGGGAVALGLLLLLFSTLYLAASAEGLGNSYAAYYPWVFLAAGAAVVLLALAILARLLKLRAQLKRGEPGARLSRRLLLLLLVLALPPVLLVYVFSVRFVSASVDTWLRANSVEAMESALELARIQMDERRDAAVERSTQVVALLQERSYDLAAALEDALDATAASQLVLFGSDSRIQQIAAADPGLLLPSPPEQDSRAQLGGGAPRVSIERFGEASYVRVLQQLDLGGDALLLQALFALPARHVELSDQVEAAAFGTRRALFLRDSLKLVFVLILSLVALVSVFLAVLIAFDLARRLVSPIGKLAAATRAIAEGRLEQLEVPARGDELGFLVESFNRMTADLAASRERAAASAAETETQRAFLATVLARLSSAVLVLDGELRLRGANPAAAELTGLATAELEGLQLAELGRLCPSLRGLVDTAAQRQREHAPEWREELAVAAGSERRLLMLRGASLPDGGQVLVIDDTTGVDRARRDAAWSEVARRLAHEVKNPLTPIQLSAERLRRRVLPRLDAEDADVLDRATHTIVAQVDALKTLVNAFGEYARPPQLELGPIDVNSLTEDVLELYDHDPRLRVVRLLDPALPHAQADAGRLRQVLHNLIKNAQEASAERPVLGLRVLSRSSASAGRRWLDLVVEDDGPGLPEGFSSDWFEPYRSTKSKGTGLGLAISRKIAEEHGGQLLAEGRSEGGARFVLRLPL